MNKLTVFAICLMTPVALISAGCVTGKGKEGCCAKMGEGHTCCAKMTGSCCSKMGTPKGAKKAAHAH